MMPILQAEESLNTLRIAQIANAQFEKDSEGSRDAQRTIEDWKQTIEGVPSRTTSSTQRSDERRKTRTRLFDLGVKKVTKETPDDKA